MPEAVCVPKPPDCSEHTVELTEGPAMQKTSVELSIGMLAQQFPALALTPQVPFTELHTELAPPTVPPALVQRNGLRKPHRVSAGTSQHRGATAVVAVQSESPVLLPLQTSL